MAYNSFVYDIGITYTSTLAVIIVMSYIHLFGNLPFVFILQILTYYTPKGFVILLNSLLLICVDFCGFAAFVL